MNTDLQIDYVQTNLSLERTFKAVCSLCHNDKCTGKSSRLRHAICIKCRIELDHQIDIMNKKIYNRRLNMIRHGIRLVWFHKLYEDDTGSHILQNILDMI